MKFHKLIKYKNIPIIILFDGEYFDYKFYHQNWRYAPTVNRSYKKIKILAKSDIDSILNPVKFTKKKSLLFNLKIMQLIRSLGEI